VEALAVNQEKSIEIAHVLAQLNFKKSFLQRPFLSLDIDTKTKAAMYYYAVGICHQTYRLAHPRLNLYGWDYLEHGFMEMAQHQPELLDAHYLKELTVNELIPLLQVFFSPTGHTKDCSLDSLEERADLYLAMAHHLQLGNQSALEYFQASNGEADYFYQNLASCRAYVDPLQKKTSFLMKLLADAQMVHFSKDQEIIPIMDYHMQRVLLRTGAVEVLDETLKAALQSRETVQEDREIREACIKSMQLIAKSAGLSVFKMNDIFYTLGRSCCNEKMLCTHHNCEKSPCTLTLAVEIEDHSRCIFQELCKGAQQKDYRKFWQPQIKTHFY